MHGRWASAALAAAAALLFAAPGAASPSTHGSGIGTVLARSIDSTRDADGNVIQERSASGTISGAFDGVYDTGELSQQTVAHELKDMAMVAGNFGFEQLFATGLKTLERALFVLLHQGGVADDVCGKNGCELPVHNRPSTQLSYHDAEWRYKAVVNVA